MVVVETMMVMLTSSVSFGGTLLIHQKTLRPCLSNNVSAFSQATTPIYIEIVREIGNRLDIPPSCYKFSEEIHRYRTCFGCNRNVYYMDSRPSVVSPIVGLTARGLFGWALG